MCAADGIISAQNTSVLSLYAILGHIIFSVWPFAIIIEMFSVSFRSSSMNLRCTLSSMGKMLSFKKDAFSRAFGFTAWFQWSAWLQYVAFGKAGSIYSLDEFQRIEPPQ